MTRTATSMKVGWRGYFVMCPDYWIQPDHVLAERDEVIATGEAGGTVDGVLWRTPAAWRAVIRDGNLLLGPGDPGRGLHRRLGARGGLEGRSYEEIAASDRAREIVQGYVDQFNSRLNRWETIRSCDPDHDLTVNDGEMTRA